MMEIVFVVCCVAMIGIDFYINRRIISLVSILCVPYMIIIVLNNFIAVRMGFYKVGDEVIEMLLLGIGCFSLGTIVTNFRKKITKINKALSSYEVENKFKFYKMRIMLKYVLGVEVLVVIRLLLVVLSKGIGYVTTSEFEGQLIRGIMGHIFLTIYPLIPILFLFWLKNKKKTLYLIATIIAIILFFFTFVKYHVIGMIVLLYFFAAYEDSQYVKKGGILVSVMAITLFVGNYFVTFLVRGVFSVVGGNYYIKHLWTYLAGSLIYDNLIFSSGVRVDTSILYKLGSFVFAPVNLFLDKILGKKICPHSSLSFIPMGTNGERGNVIDAIGYLYPSEGSRLQVVGFMLILFSIGVIFSLIYNKALKKRNQFSIMICTFMTFFVFFSFFGTFYVSVTPWEILFWSQVIPLFFDKRIKIYLRKH